MQDNFRLRLNCPSSLPFKTFALIIALFLAPVSMAEVPISITSFVDISFGVLISEDGTCTLSNQGLLTGTNGQSCSGSGTLGDVNISGENDFFVVLSVAQSSSGGVTFIPTISGVSSFSLGSQGSRDKNIAGQLVISNPSISGNLSISYLITANYE